MGFVQCMPKRALHSAPPGALLPHIRGWEVYARVPVCTCTFACGALFFVWADVRRPEVNVRYLSWLALCLIGKDRVSH